MARRCSHVLALLAALCVFWGLAAADDTLRAMQMPMDGMPDDPVSGEMVMSRDYNFALRNGQRLRFAREETLAAFLKDPSAALGDVASPARDHDHADDGSVLCPVCGMESSLSDGPQVRMAHGDQAIHTCSMTHAHQVHDQILNFRDADGDGHAAGGAGDSSTKETGFCSGSGTTMLNGFSLSSDGATPCILLWFPGWVLSSRFLYILGGVGVALVAVFNEYLLQLRRVLRKESSVKRLLSSSAPHAAESAQLLRSTSQSMPLAESCGPNWFRTLSPDMQHAVHCALHGLTLFIAYMLMLVSMTYDMVLLLWCVGGYVLGHYVFGERREAAGNGDLGAVNFP